MSDFGIDLGTANTVVYDAAQEVVFDEPSVLLRRGSGGRRGGVVAVGREAAELLGRVPAGTTALRPLQDGVITDLETARAYLRAVVRRAVSNPWQRSHGRVAIGVPSGATELERRALLEAADEAGVHRAIAIDEPIAGAVGCGIDPMERRAHMVVDVGGGTAEATVFCYGGVLTARSCRIAGDEMTVAIFRHLREHHQLIVGEQTAEQVKMKIGYETEPSIAVPGLDAGTGHAQLATVPVRGDRRGPPADHRHDHPDARGVPARPAAGGGGRHPGRRGPRVRRGVPDPRVRPAPREGVRLSREDGREPADLRRGRRRAESAHPGGRRGLRMDLIVSVHPTGPCIGPVASSSSRWSM